MRPIASITGLLLFAALIAWTGGPAQAHSTPDTAITLGVTGDAIEAGIVVPVNELRFAMASPEAMESDAQRDAERLANHVFDRISVTDADGERWAIALQDARIARHQGQDDLELELVMRPPDGSALRNFTLGYDAVIATVANHVVFVFAGDGSPAADTSEPRLIGALRQGSQTIDIELGLGEGWRGFVAALYVGIEHILIGYDHVLFIVALVLPAPLLAGRGGWAAFGGAGYTVGSLLKVLTAFTVGHTCTLIGGAVLGWRLPVQPVEVLIALSILVTAIHAWRPIFPRREIYVAAGFGLVHGLAFAAIIAEYGAETIQQARTILGFNLGIEVVQILLAAALLPALLFFASGRHYASIRKTGAALIGAAASIWLITRILGLADPMAPLLAAIFAYGLWELVALNLAVALLMMQRWRGNRAIFRRPVPREAGDGEFG